MTQTLTGIPVDLLIAAFGMLCASIGGVMWHELRALRAEAQVRGGHITALRVMMRLVCQKLNLPYPEGD
jgi:hypothetical protein